MLVEVVVIEAHDGWLEDMRGGRRTRRLPPSPIPVEQRRLGLSAGQAELSGERSPEPGGRVFLEGPPRSMPGLSLLPVVTRFRAPKRTRQVHGTTAVKSAVAPSGTQFVGYEIHTGVTRRRDGSPFALVAVGQDVAEEDGAVSPDGLVVGTLVHALFEESSATQAIVASLARRRGAALPVGSASVDAGAWFRSAVDIPALISIFGLR